ncbi:MAG: glycosyl transferase family 2 [Desulfobacteraceae bacterium]|nr:MAG: glycosyl transferase family 2 [Desulfobacteraceae bacterium]
MNELITPPTIVAVGYNRPHDLKRLLHSLGRSIYPNKTRLVISLDQNDNKDTLAVAETFQWRHGDKEILFSETRLGCKNHIRRCGDLAETFENVIILEDDIFVSPQFYVYALDALKFYRHDENISGISLYSHGFNETALLPFTPIQDRTDVFFLQIPSSWGELWTQKHWKDFQTWQQQDKTAQKKRDAFLPVNVRAWNENSTWEVDFIRYMIDQNKYFVYPRVSYTTNFGTVGTHFPENIKLHQRPLQYDTKEFHFIRFEESNAVYDANCEILPECLNRLTPLLQQYDYEVDLYGVKSMEACRKDFLLTSKQTRSPILSFGKEMKPHETNLVEGIEGRDIFLSHKNDIIEADATPHFTQKTFFYYYEMMTQHYLILQKDYMDRLDLADHFRAIEILKFFFRTVKIRILDILKKK